MIKKNMWSWVLVALWMALIFVLSSIPDLRSGFQPLWDIVLRKIAHAGVFGVLAWLMYRALRLHGLEKRRAMTIAFIVTLIYAISDEYHQSFVPGRKGTWYDVLIDSFGGFVAVYSARGNLPTRHSLR